MNIRSISRRTTMAMLAFVATCPLTWAGFHYAQWDDKEGVTHTVSTTCKDGESGSKCLDRHTKEVTALQKQYPPKN